MNQDSTAVRSPLFKRRWFQISGAIILLLLMAGGVEWWLQSGRATATALFQISGSPPSFSGAGNQPLNEYEYENLKKTQIALLQSDFVLASALRNPSIGALSIVQRHMDPVEWLQDSLKIDYPKNGSILSISLTGDESERDDLVNLVDAIAHAYRNEVIDEVRARRLGTRDLLSRNLDNLNSEIKRKLDEYLDIARELGHLEQNNGQVIQSLDLKRLERNDDELTRLENQLAIEPSDKPAKAKAIENRLAELHKRHDEIWAELSRHIERSADLEVRRRDLDQLQSIAAEMSTRLEWLDLDALAPDQIRQVQPAVISPQSLSSRFSVVRQQTASTK